MSLKLNWLIGGSLKLRSATFFVSALAIIIIPFSLFVYFQFDSEIKKNFDASLYNYTSEIAESLNWSLFGSLALSQKEILAEKKVLPFSFRFSYLQIIDSKGRWISGHGPRSSIQLPVTKASLMTTLSQNAFIQTITLNKKKYRMINYPIIKKNLPEKLILQIAVPTTTLANQQKKIKNYLYITIPLLLVITFITGYLFSELALSPLNVIIRKTKDMQATDLSQRLPIRQDKDDELNQLSETLNQLFDRLHQAFQNQEEFIANASHQLKTPLAIIQGQLDVFRKNSRSKEELDEFLKHLDDEMFQLTSLVNNLLILASLDSGKQSLSKKEILIDEVLFSAVSRLKPYADKNKVSFNFEITSEGSSALSQSKILADEYLIHNLFQVLLENAIKHSPVDKDIKITLDANEDFFFINFHNDGESISKEEYEKIFHRFYQSTNKKNNQGVGLGLAIAKKIAENHQAEILVESHLQHGTSFIFKIKRF